MGGPGGRAGLASREVLFSYGECLPSAWHYTALSMKEAAILDEHRGKHP
jgi:hypothetical protein